MAKSFSEMNQVNNSLLIVDSLNVAFRWKHIGYTEFKEDFLRTVESFRKSYKAKHVIITADQGGSSYRKGIYPEYKANRKEKFADQTEEESLAFELFIEEYEATIEYLKENSQYTIFRFPKVEADDIAAYVVSKIRKLDLEEVWLLSTDADWDLLLDTNVHRFSYKTRKEFTLNNWHTHHDYPHEHHLSIKCLMGDTGDNVKGVESIGPKRAAELVANYGSALDIATMLPITSRLKYMAKLNESRDLILLNYELMDLKSFCEVALGRDNCAEIDRTLDGIFNDKL